MKEDRVAQYRQEFAVKSEDELLFIIHDNYEFSERHIAAKQLLSSMRDATEQRRHTESLAESAGANKLSKIAIGIAVFAAAVAVSALVLQWRGSPASKQSTETTTTPSKETQPPPLPSSSPVIPAQTTISSTKPPAPKLPAKP